MIEPCSKCKEPFDFLILKKDRMCLNCLNKLSVEVENYLNRTDGI